jgi:hypothetical protein
MRCQVLNHFSSEMEIAETSRWVPIYDRLCVCMPSICKLVGSAVGSRRAVQANLRPNPNGISLFKVPSDSRSHVGTCHLTCLYPFTERSWQWRLLAGLQDDGRSTRIHKRNPQKRVHRQRKSSKWECKIYFSWEYIDSVLSFVYIFSISSFFTCPS